MSINDQQIYMPRVARFLSEAVQLPNSGRDLFCRHGNTVACFITITPSDAKEALARQKNVRRLQPKNQQRIEMDLIAERWVVNGESVKFDSEGYLVDGQHRMAAIAKTGISATMLVVFGVGSARVDEGRPRAFSDICGELRATRFASTTRAIMWACRGVDPYGKHQVCTNGELEDAARLLGAERIRGAVEFSSTLGRFSGGNASALLHWAAAYGGRACDYEAFWAPIKSGVGLVDSTPQHRLHEWFVNHGFHGSAGHKSVREAYMRIVRAYKAWMVNPMQHMSAQGLSSRITQAPFDFEMFPSMDQLMRARAQGLGQ